ncbi:MAG: rhomboid family intramembrane serine protease [Planctomycetaceae bacterium]|nr:MAG: rhomboid family intramembrane serine protease [Planctomycetaceae bacterium]
MIPIRDSIPSTHTPFVNYAMILLCGMAFFAQVSSDDGGQRIIERYGMVPLRLTDPAAVAAIPIQEQIATPLGMIVQERMQVLAPSAINPWMTILTCMFLHGGWMHFLGNMWFLFIFGDNVEDRFGHLGYLLLYLGTGIAAAVSHWATDMNSPIPTIGASGAIAGVMGAYALLYPHARVMTVLPIFIFLHFFVLPAPVFLGIWFVFQMVSGVAAGSGSTGVAWWAHIGGFIAGALLALVVKWIRFGRTETTETSRPHRF